MFPTLLHSYLKSTWLSVAAANATPATWEALHAAARTTQGQVERSTLYALLGSANDATLARRALNLAVSDEPGKTISAGMITSVANTDRKSTRLNSSH